MKQKQTKQLRLLKRWVRATYPNMSGKRLNAFIRHYRHRMDDTVFAMATKRNLHEVAYIALVAHVRHTCTTYESRYFDPELQGSWEEYRNECTEYAKKIMRTWE